MNIKFMEEKNTNIVREFLLLIWEDAKSISGFWTYRRYV